MMSDYPSMFSFLDLPEDEQDVVEVRYTGWWDHRVIGLHDGLLIVVSLDPNAGMWYPEFMFETWVIERPDSQILPLGFSSVTSYQMFIVDHPGFDFVQEAVLHWLHDEVSLDDPALFLP